LKRELSKLNHKDLYWDGTFSLVRNSDFSQIHIISIIDSNGGYAVFSYPCMVFLMKKQSTENYVEILQVIKNLYFSEFGPELENLFFHSDSEHAFMLAVLKVLPESSIILGSVHILRNLLKNIKSKIDTDLFKNNILLYVWRVLSGSLFSR
jgi:hypothetical protein